MAQQPTTSTSPAPSRADELREEIKKKVVKRTLFQMHIVLYIIVNLVLFAINQFITNGYLWYPWVATGWGVALFIHIFAYTAPNANLMAYHGFIYLLLNIYLAFIDWYVDRQFNWVGWSIGGWGIGLIIHLVFYLIYSPGKNEDPSKSWIDRKIDAELKAQNITSPIPKNPTSESTTLEKICPKCKKVNPPDGSYCAACGQELK